MCQHWKRIERSDGPQGRLFICFPGRREDLSICPEPGSQLRVIHFLNRFVSFY